MGVSQPFIPNWPGTAVLLISTFLVVMTTGMCHHTWNSSFCFYLLYF
jgi:hypothetical protein